MADESPWRVLIVEDDPVIAAQLAGDATSGKLIPSAGVVDAVVCAAFEDALDHLEKTRFDFLILDLRNDAVAGGTDDASAGLSVFQEIKRRRFVPIVFYTALPAHVRHLETPFVRVVEKTEGLLKLRTELDAIFQTRLPALSRHLEETQREYMWEFVDKNWRDPTSEHAKADLAFMLARRLANVLSGPSVRRFLMEQSGTDPEVIAVGTIHPVEMYIYPPTNSHHIAGDILKGSIRDYDDSTHWVLLTPSCDFAHNKVDFAILARCLPLDEFSECKKFLGQVSHGQEPSRSARSDLEKLLQDRRKTQPERYRFLPATFFLPDLVVDFQSLVQVSLKSLDAMERIASLDSPFAEALGAGFARYYRSTRNAGSGYGCRASASWNNGDRKVMYRNDGRCSDSRTTSLLYVPDSCHRHKAGAHRP